MRRLDGASAFLIYNDKPRSYQHTLKIAILDFDSDPEGYSYGKLVEGVEDAIQAYPFLKWKIARVPLGINHPYWEQDTDFDLSHHVRRVACPGPGDKAAFCNLVSELYAQQLNQNLPLWIVWVVEGLEHNRVAMVALFHHAYVDGVGASKVLEGLFTPEKRPQLTSKGMGVNPHKNPNRAFLLLHGLAGLPLIFIHQIPALISARRRGKNLEKTYLQSGKTLPPSPTSAPDSPFNVALGHGRTFAYESLNLAEFKRVGKSLEVTINDLLVAAVCGAIRFYYQAHGLPADQPLVAGIPINMRTEAQQQEYLGNYIGNSTVGLPIHLQDALERLNAVRQSTQTMKEHIEATGGGGLGQAVELIPPFVINLINWAQRKRKGKLILFGNMLISNVAGPKTPMYLGNVKVHDWLSIGQVTLGLGLNITAWSYVDKLNVCLMADKKVIPDGAQFLGYLTQSFEEYQGLSHSVTESKLAPMKGEN